MRLNGKTIFIVAACLTGAGLMFFLGVMTERRWAARRLVATADTLDLAARVTAAAARADSETVDVNQLDFPEALRCNDPRPQAIDPLAGSETDTTAPARAASRPSPAPAGAGSIFLQVGSFAHRENADRFMAKLAAKGFDPTLQATTDPAQASRFRVRVGPFDSLDDASPTIATLERERLKYLLIR